MKGLVTKETLKVMGLVDGASSQKKKEKGTAKCGSQNAKTWCYLMRELVF